MKYKCKRADNDLSLTTMATVIAAMLPGGCKVEVRCDYDLAYDLFDYKVRATNYPGPPSVDREWRLTADLPSLSVDAFEEFNRRFTTEMTDTICGKLIHKPPVESPSHFPHWSLRPVASGSVRAYLVD